MITREEAVEILNRLSDSLILEEKLEYGLYDILKCIEAENEGLFLWGADDDYIDLYVTKREDLITDEWLKHLAKVREKYRIKEVQVDE